MLHPSPEGQSSEDQMAFSVPCGGQFITGNAVLPEVTGPKPLDRPATAMKTMGTSDPSYCATMLSVSAGPLCAEVTRIWAGTPSSRHVLAIFAQCPSSLGDPIRMTTLRRLK